MFRRKQRKIHDFYSSNRKRTYKNFLKIEKKLIAKIYLVYYNLSIAQDLGQAHYHIIVNNLYEGIHKTQCKYRHDDKKCETPELNTKGLTVFLNT